MDDFLKNIRKKLSVDNIVEFVKEEQFDINNHEQEVRKTIEKIEPNDIVGLDEIASKLKEFSEEATPSKEDVKTQDAPKPEVYSVLQKPSRHDPEAENPYLKEDNVSAFFD